jgi:hypothetical protein
MRFNIAPLWHLHKERMKVIVVGGGLVSDGLFFHANLTYKVGSLQALYMAQRGHEVHVYEGRPGTIPSFLPTNTWSQMSGPSPNILVSPLTLRSPLVGGLLLLLSALRMK